MKGHHLDVRTALRFLYINHNLDLGVAFYSPSSRKLKQCCKWNDFFQRTHSVLPLDLPSNGFDDYTTNCALFLGSNNCDSFPVTAPSPLSH